MKYPPSRTAWSKWLRFSICGSLVLIGTIGAGLGWLMRCERLQREAVHSIRRSGGRVWYDSDLEKARTRPTEAPVEFICGHMLEAGEELRLLGSTARRPKWLVDLLGDRYSENAIAVEIYERGTDAVAVNLGCLSSLRKVTLQGSPITDAGLVHLSHLRCLQSLDLNNTRVGDAGLAHLSGLTELRKLFLNHTSVTDKGLAHLKEMKRLEMLVLGRTQITDAGLIYLKAMTRLEDLYLTNCAISDAGLTSLKGMTSLRYLLLRDAGVTDAGVDKLRSALPQLVIDYTPEWYRRERAREAAEWVQANNA